MDLPETEQWFDDAGDYKAGRLLREGALEAQPVRWLEAQREIAAEVSRIDAEEIRAKSSQTTPSALPGSSKAGRVIRPRGGAR